jgi:hypothetical protein
MAIILLLSSIKNKSGDGFVFIFYKKQKPQAFEQCYAVS